MSQYPIPQFIEEEGKIIFFLTYRQFFLLLGGGALCFFLFLTLPLLFFAICSVLIMAVVFAIAFLQIDNQPVLKLILNYFVFLTGTKDYIWKKDHTTKK